VAHSCYQAMLICNLIDGDPVRKKCRWFFS
jgi:hypothetical protein